MAVSEQQLELIERQLGRKPRGLVAIAWQNQQGIPAVLQMRSLVDDQPFPTLYWLSSKDLYQAIAEIETGGEVKRIEQQIETDDELRCAHLADQQRYVNLRWRLMAEGDRQRIATLGFSDLFNQYGIGGIRHWEKVRCLHMQYAFHLAAGGTAIGRLLDNRYGLDKLQLTQ
ncbi:DUF501 domain-containing protein [Amphritea pacifica]|uniref:DUF501 domain-containing protein n=1 Tax=Amphritea pacifica TaxID=2811233 RepID=A0ABS2W2N2_9GAMM|nr:DUF501 domain-containing protein [Amphritea pacifica]MBN0985968.1 DUF501 domain-containing protein [Amphritea pacifica]MBN1008199.1 DUF501 domain-containing protein [Amphritea pacifica]